MNNKDVNAVVRINRDKLLSIVIPVFNESIGLEDLIQELSDLAKEINALGLEVELVFVDNDSDDSTWEKLNLLYEETTDAFFVTIVRHVLNRGMQASLATGIAHSHGNAIAVVQADLQDPPELIVEMVLHWLDGSDFVATRITKRDSSAVNRISSWLFYRILRSVSSQKSLNDSSDFYLIDENLAKKLLKSLSANPFLRTTLFELRKPDQIIDYVRKNRAEGDSKFNYSRKISFALDGILRDLGTVVRLVSLSAILLGVTSLIALFFLVFSYLVGYRSPVSGWISTVTLEVLSLAVLSLVGAVSIEFLNRIYRELPYRGLEYVSDSKTSVPTEKNSK
jgi:glycosyltransferase involved in cell wall biosynthesis